MLRFEFEGFEVRELKTEQRMLQTVKKINNQMTTVTIFHAVKSDSSFDLLYCAAENGDIWIQGENVSSPSAHLQRISRRRMGIDEAEGSYYCRLWQEQKSGNGWSKTKKTLPLSQIMRFSSQNAKTVFDEIGTLEKLFKNTSRERNQFAVKFDKNDHQTPLIAYLLTRVLPLM